MKFRRIVFWLHLLAGLLAGLVVAVMSFTGVAIAFEQELLAWADREVARVEPPEAGAARPPLDETVARASEVSGGAKLSAATRYRDPTRADIARIGRDRTIYVNPYTGEAREPDSGSLAGFLNQMTQWHRWLGMSGEGRAIGKAITGACNLAFLFLVVSGFYLWMPRRWNRRLLRPILWFTRSARGKARDFNWHNVIGFWSAPILIVLVATAVVISYPWASNLVYRLAGEEAPPPRSGPPRGGPAVQAPAPEAGAPPLSLQEIVDKATQAWPDWREITARLDSLADGPAPSDSGPVPAVTLSLKQDQQWPLFSSTQLSIDPYRGAIVEQSGFESYSAGRQARSWMRFLHTGEAFGVFGKTVASLATLGSLVLVWTGFALSWRRFFARDGRGQASPSRTAR